LPRPGGFHAADEYGHDAQAALERGPDLESHAIIGVIQPPAAVVIGDRQPFPADQGDQDHTGAQCGFDRFREIKPRLYGVQVHEDPYIREVAGDMLLEEARIRSGVETTGSIKQRDLDMQLQCF